MEQMMKKMSMILLAIIGTLVGLGPLVLMASVNTARYRNAKRYQSARRQLTTATELVKDTMAGVDMDRSGPDKMAQAQIRQLQLAYQVLKHEVGKRLFWNGERLFPNTSNPMIYAHRLQFDEAAIYLRAAGKWVSRHIGNYVNCQYCGAHGVSRSDTCPQTLQPTSQSDEPYDVEVERNQYITDDEGNFSHMETITELETRYRQHGKNHRGELALDWAKTRYDHDTIKILVDWNNNRNLQTLVEKYNQSVSDAAL